MKPKTIKITYWLLVIVFCLFNIMDAIGGLTKAKDGVDAMQLMGYPLYLMPFLGILKLLGVFALLQDKFKTIKEWAFAGFTFTLIGATVSHAAVNDKTLFIIMPAIILVLLFGLYYFWRKFELVKAA